MIILWPDNHNIFLDMSKKHVVRNIFLIVGAFILLLIILAQIFKNDIVKLAIAKGAKTFDVPLTVGDVDFSLLYRFPLATIEFNDVVMTGYSDKADSLIAASDTIIRLGKLYASVDVWELMDGNIMVKKVDIEDADVRYIVDSLGNSNLDFLLKVDADTVSQEEVDTAAVQGVYALDKLTLSDIVIDYRDNFMKFNASLLIPEVNINGSFTSEGYSAATKGEVHVKSIDYDDFHLEGLNRSIFTFDVTALNDTIDVDNIQLDAAGAVLNAKGIIAQGDSLYADLDIEGSEIDLENSFNLLSQKLKETSGLSKLQGVFNIKGNAKGFITPTSVPEFNFDMELKEGVAQYDTYPVVKNINVSTSLTNTQANSLEYIYVNLKGLHAETEQSKVEFAGIVQNLEHIKYDLNSNMNLSLDEISPYIPDSLGVAVNGYVNAKITTSGVVPDSITDDFTDYVLGRTSVNLTVSDIGVRMDSIPEIKNLSANLNYQPGHFSMAGLQVRVPEYKVNLTNGYLKSSFKGKVANYKQMSVQIDSLLLALDNQTSVSASGKINGFEDVQYALKSHVHLDLSEIYNMLPDSIANSMVGTVSAGFNSKGNFKMDSVTDKAMALLFENSDFNFSLNNVTVDMPDTLMNVSSLNGDIKYREDSIFMNGVAGNYNGLDFLADSTYISKVYTAAVLNQPKEMRIHGNFGAGDLDYAFIEGFLDDTDTIPIPEEEMKAKMEAKESGEAYEMKFTYKVNGKAKLKSFKYGDILVENLDTKFLADIKGGKYVAKDLKCSVFGGDVSGAVKYKMSTEAIEDTIFRDVMEFRLGAESLDVSRMMDELNEYVVEYGVSKENVQGLLSSNMDGRIVMENYEPVYDSMMISGDLKLENGALIGMKAISDMESIPGIGIKNLDNLQFHTLTSNLFMYRNNIFIPKTDIFSNSFEASFLGMYSFSGDYDFHVRAILGQILSGKVNKRSKEELESGFDPDDKGRYYVSSYIDGKSKAWFDNKKDREKMTTRIRMNKRGLQVLFNPLLVTYDTDIK